MNHIPQPKFLPISQKEADNLGIAQCDIILISGDAYLDHPMSATALLGRSLWSAGFTVGVIPQPDIKEKSDFEAFNPPKLFYSVSGGSMDSMVAHYTPALRKRSSDAYSPAGIQKRPDRATLVYTDRIHQFYPDVPIIIGGVEASLRRFAHFDYWSDKIRQSLLADAPANLLVYGMGEQQLEAIAKELATGTHISKIRNIAGTCWKISPKEWRESYENTREEILEIPSFSEVSEDSAQFARSHHLIRKEQDPFHGRKILQRHPKTYIIQNQPACPMTTDALDHIYDLPYQRRAHPSYQDPIPALDPIRFSITSHRGCFGNCSFCALAMHQGMIIQSRSSESIFREVKRISLMPEFKGTIPDIGGPSVNMYGDWCRRWEADGVCEDRDCITCKTRETGFSRYLDILDAAEKIPGIKHVFIGSGLRYDLVPGDKSTMERICTHVSGQMKVAPEHIAAEVVHRMNKPERGIFDSFRDNFEAVQKGRHPRQFIIPYLMSGHPGCTVRDMIQLAEYLRDHHLYTEQVQDFTPTPMTASTCMYHSGYDPETMERVHIPKGEEKRMQRAILSWKDPTGYDLVCAGLKQEGREDLIGNGTKCLITRRNHHAGPSISRDQKTKERKGTITPRSSRNR